MFLIGCVFQGAVYIFHQPPGSTVWRQTQKLYAQRPVEGEQFGFSVAMNEFFIVIGVPYRSLSPARTETVRSHWLSFVRWTRGVDRVHVYTQGAIEVYQRQYIYAKTDNFTHVHLATLFLTNPQTSDRLGTSVSISSYFIGAGGPSRFTDTESDAVRWFAL
jgi:FG-GAP repeat